MLSLRLLWQRTAKLCSKQSSISCLPSIHCVGKPWKIACWLSADTILRGIKNLLRFRYKISLHIFATFEWFFYIIFRQPCCFFLVPCKALIICCSWKNLFLSKPLTRCCSLNSSTFFSLRLTYDAHKNEMNSLNLRPRTTSNINKQAVLNQKLEASKLEYEQIRNDVDIKLQFLDENRVRLLFYLWRLWSLFIAI